MARLLKAFLPSGAIDEGAIGEAARLLRAGRLVAIPTETVYGLAANALDRDAVLRIFEAKGRPSFNPLIVHVTGASAARGLAREWPATAQQLADAFWPGPLTVVVPRAPQIPLEVTAGLDSVALRAPSHPVARAVLERSGLPLAAPSANRSNAVSPTRAEHVLASLGDRVDAVLDGGPCTVGIESTVVDVTKLPPTILRPGGISAAVIERLVGTLSSAPASEGATGRASPGMLPKHYAPAAITLLVPAGDLGELLRHIPSDARVGGVVVNAPQPDDVRITRWETLGSDPVLYARGLYDALHRLEDAGVTHVLLEQVRDAPEWQAVADRLRRAAGADPAGESAQ
jgi:L-threonylcarbamoyladenylate synthase